MNLISVIQSLWDRIASVSDKAAIKVLIAIVIGYFLFNGSKQQDEKDITIKNLRQDNVSLKKDLSNFGIRYDVLSDKYVNLSMDIVETLQQGQKRQDSINKTAK